MKQIFNTEVSVITNRYIDIKEIEDTDFVYYEDIHIEYISENQSYKGENRTVYTGITSKENINAVNGLNHVNKVIDTPKLYNNKGYVMAIKKEHYDLIMSGEFFISEAIEASELVKHYDPENYVYVIYNFSEHKALDLNYNRISLPFYFDYVRGCVDDKTYNLKDLLKHLKNHPYVLNKEKLVIQEIPWYNREPDRQMSLSFKCLLPLDLYEEVLSKNCLWREHYILDEILEGKRFKYDYTED